MPRAGALIVHLRLLALLPPRIVALGGLGASLAGLLWRNSGFENAW